LEVVRARRILKAMREAQAAGRGAVSLDGRMIDAASVRQAEVMVAKARSIAVAAKKAAGKAKGGGKRKTPKAGAKKPRKR
jgi:hypothetical protein